MSTRTHVRPPGLARKVIFMAKAEYFTGQGPGGRLVSWFMSRDGQVAVDRDDTRAAVGSRSARLLLPQLRQRAPDP